MLFDSNTRTLKEQVKNLGNILVDAAGSVGGAAKQATADQINRISGGLESGFRDREEHARNNAEPKAGGGISFVSVLILGFALLWVARRVRV